MKSTFKFYSLSEAINFFKLETNFGKEFIIEIKDRYHKNGLYCFDKEFAGIFMGLSYPTIKFLNKEGDIIFYNLTRHFLFQNQKILEINEI